ncbi:MAG: hypothetical protein ACF788_03850 [Novipirellula sp. JB048]
MLAFMKNVVVVLMNLILASTFLVSTFLVSTCGATDWLTLPSKYSHDPVTSQRVAQYRPAATPSIPETAHFRTSGYTHVRSHLRHGASSDNYHRVESWGDPVRPYGEWQRPFRPYSVPYPYWGAPFAGLHIAPYPPMPYRQDGDRGRHDDDHHRHPDRDDRP